MHKFYFALMLTLLSVLLFAQKPTGGGGLYPPDWLGDVSLLADSPIEGSVSRENDPTVMRERFVTVNTRLLADSENPIGGPRQEVVALNLFDNVVLHAEYLRTEQSSPKGFSWVGRVIGIKWSSVVIVKRGDIIAANIALPGYFFQIRYVGKGVHAVYQIDQSQFPGCANDAYPQEAAPIDSGRVESAGLDDGSTIDVMVVYTAAARTGAGSAEAMEALIDLAVAETNTSYANSNVVQRMNLVHTVEVDYTESGNISTDRGRLSGTDDGFMDEIHGLRDTYHADGVSLIVENGGGYCGIAYIMTSVSSSFQSQAFNVTARNCATGYYSFGHEFGHNMGARHDRFVDPTENSPFSYNHGYLNTAAGWRSVMSYNNACSNAGTSCTRIPYWSNPDVTYGGNVMGIAEGQADAADNHKALNNTAFTFANYRQGDVAPGTINPIPGYASGSVTTRSPEFGWYDASSDWYQFWLTDDSGATLLRQWYQASSVCSDGDCTIAPELDLANGTYSWYVRGNNSFGTGEWNQGTAFSVAVDVPPGSAQLLYPQGLGVGKTPTFGWMQVDADTADAATRYYLWVKGVNGPVIQTWYSLAEVSCTNGTCTVTPDVILANGNYSWWIQTGNEHGNGPWSQPMQFTVRAEVEPLVPVPATPIGAVSTTHPTFAWPTVIADLGEAADAATWYHLWVNGPTGVVTKSWYRVADICSGGNCEVVLPEPFELGEHVWWVRSWNEYGYSKWSPSTAFSVEAGINSQFNGSHEGWTPYGGEWLDTAAEYTAQGISDKDVTIAHESVFSDLDYKVRMRRAGCTRCANSLFVRGEPEPLLSNNSWKDHYVFSYSINGLFSVYKRVAYNWTALQVWTSSAALNKGDAWNELRVTAQGDQLAFYINNVLVWSGTDSSFTQGRVGVRSYSDGTAGDQVWVDWVTLSDNVPSDTFDMVVSPEQQLLNEEAWLIQGGTPEIAPD